MVFRVIISMGMVLSGTSAMACNPHTSLQSPTYNVEFLQYISADADTGISKEQYDDLIESFYEEYDGEVQAKGGKLVFPESDWDNGSVNGYARRDGNEWRVHILGGYARHELATVDAVMFLTCHELGHHLAETAYYPGKYKWAAAEGQADYYSTLKCMRRMLIDEDNKAVVSKMQIPEVLKKSCEEMFEEENDQLICQRGAMGGYSMTQIWENGYGTFKFSTPDPRIVTKTYSYHPDNQCRIDTYLQGALCTKSHEDKVSGDSYVDGTCTISEGFQVGLRPTCWFYEDDFRDKKINQTKRLKLARK